jgi:hypothetical protein
VTAALNNAYNTMTRVDTMTRVQCAQRQPNERARSSDG